jgi:beta-mannosidase
MPTAWSGKSMELGIMLEPEIPSLPTTVPGSVQNALRLANKLPDWFIGLNSQACEWVEHREWMFTTELPDEWFAEESRVIVHCGGLDGNGVVIFNKKQVGEFDNAFIPYRFDLSDACQKSGNKLHIVFRVPPRWLGQIGYTSQMTDWKPRFNYGWDWIPRIVQIGPWEPVTLEFIQKAEISSFRLRTDWHVESRTGQFWIKGDVEAPSGSKVRITMLDGEKTVWKTELEFTKFSTEMAVTDLAVEPWWPNGEGDRKLYNVRCELLDSEGNLLDQQERRIGFKNITWQRCSGAPEAADPWICAINGRPLFLQGVNWTPIRPTFADLKREDYERLVQTYIDLGCNFLRVWGGAFLEKKWFYDLCDELGILVWQEFPLSSSGHENWPPEDELSMEALLQIARSYITRRQHHASLLMWCGGNELQGGLDGGKEGVGKPVDFSHPLMRRWQKLLGEEDPGRRFVPSSSSGPRFSSDEKDLGKGLHWDVHGPWKPPGENSAEWAKYWNQDDALLRSEAGSPGASSVDLLTRYADGMPLMPPSMDNPLWRRFSWWIQKDEFQKDQGREPVSIEEYVDWSQAQQTTALTLAVEASKKRFPGMGGIFIWMGHDSFPCMANTSIIDFEGRPKPAALAIAKIWKSRPAAT